MADIEIVVNTQNPVVTVTENPTTVSLDLNTANMSQYALISYVDTISGILASQIGSNSSSVVSIEGLSGIIDVVGTGNITISTGSNSLIISGSALSVTSHRHQLSSGRPCSMPLW